MGWLDPLRDTDGLGDRLHLPVYRRRRDGVQLANAGLDRALHDTYYVVAHFHYVLVARRRLRHLAAWYYWFPKMTGYMYSEFLGQAAFLGDVRRREPDLLPAALPRARRHAAPLHRLSGRLCRLNMVSSTAPTSRRVGVLIFLFCVAEAFAKKRVAGDNPWGEGANTLEWQLVFAAAVPPVGAAPADQVTGNEQKPPVSAASPRRDTGVTRLFLPQQVQGMDMTVIDNHEVVGMEGAPRLSEASARDISSS